MNAIVRTRYGTPDDLALRDVPTPAPGDGDVRVRAASLNAADWHLLTADIPLVRLASGLFRPRHHVLGVDVAGVVDAVGRGVTTLAPGDDVFGDLSRCGYGALAEYACAPAAALAPAPRGLTPEQAAAVPLAGATALQALRDRGRVRAGDHVLVQGAAGGVGTFAMQIAKALGARVTAVCSARNADQARGLGADRVVNYAVTDVTAEDARYDVILAVNGYHPIRTYKRMLAPGGRYLMVGGGTRQMYQALALGKLLSLGGDRRWGS